MSILIITEKPSVARSISHVVKADKNKKEYIEGSGYIISWCLGHLVGLKLPDEYNKGWHCKWSFSQLPMIPDKWLFKVSESTKAQFNILKTLMNRNDVTEIICATDADREGECIFRYVYNMIGCHKPVMRLWVSSLEETEILRSLDSMKPMNAYDNLFSAGYTRAKADWLAGMNFSRLFSCRYKSNLNIGRVQTPTLAMIVKRDNDVKNFVMQRYFTADLDCGDFILSSARIDYEKTVDNVVNICNGNTAVISSVKREIKTVNPPKLYDLTTLQRDANKAYGYTAQQTLDCVQALYEAKIVTYPRTDSQYLSDDMKQTTLEIIDILKNIMNISGMENPDIKRCINNSKVAGHHAIIPTESIKSADLNKFPTSERNILNLIANRLICAAAAPYKYEAVKITALCNDMEFTANGKSVIEQGWKKYVLKTEENDDIKVFPAVSEGQQFRVTASKSEHFTSPPKAYTEDTLLSAMEHAGQENYDENSDKKGLGTPATRAGIIECLIKNRYAERKGRQITATEKGINLVNAVPDEIKSAKLTADWETKLQKIENDCYSADTFMSEIENFVREICRKYGTEDSSLSFPADNRIIGKCPKCSGDIIKGKFGCYCKNKCGMVVSKVYGIELSESQVIDLLNGNQVIYRANGIKNTVLPEVYENNYNGKTYYQWKTERKKINGK